MDCSYSRFKTSLIAALFALACCRISVAAETAQQLYPPLSLNEVYRLAENDSHAALQQAYRALQHFPAAKASVQLELMTFIAVREYRQGAFLRAQKIAQQAYQLAEAQQQTETMARMQSMLGLLYYQQGRLNQALMALDRSEQIAQQSGNGKELIRARVNRGLIYREGYFEPLKALQMNMQTLVLAQELHYGKAISYLLNNLSESLLDIGLTDIAFEYAQESLSQKQRIGDKRGIANSLRTSAAIRNRLGEPNQALQLISKAFSLIEGRDFPREVGQLYLLEAQSQRLLGQVEQAKFSYLRALPLFVQARDDIHHLSTILALAELLLEVDDTALTEHWLNYAQSRFGSVPELASGQLGMQLNRLQSKLHLKLAEPHKAQAIIEPLLAQNQQQNLQQGNPLFLASLYELSAEIASGMGQQQRAYHDLKQAHQLHKVSHQTQYQQLLTSVKTVFAMHHEQEDKHQQNQQQQIKQLQMEKQMLGADLRQQGWVFSLLLLFCLGGLIYFRLSERKPDSGNLPNQLDAPSGLYHRRYISQLISEQLQQDRESGEPQQYAMLLFKLPALASQAATQDASQRLLKPLVTQLRQRCAQGEMLARWQADSFLIVAKARECAELERLASRLLATLPSIQTESGLVELSGSLGMVHFSSSQLNTLPGSNWLDMLNIAAFCQSAAEQTATDSWISADLRAWKKGSRYLMNLFLADPEICIKRAGIRLSSSLPPGETIHWPIEKGFAQIESNRRLRKYSAAIQAKPALDKQWAG